MCCAPFFGDGFVMKVQPCSSASSANTGSKHTVLITHYLTSYHLLQQGAAAQLQGGALSLATEVSGLGPLFRLRATLHNHGKGALRDLLVVVQPPAAVYALPEGAQRGVPLLLPLTHLSLVRPCCSLPGSKRMISTQKSILCTKPKKRLLLFWGCIPEQQDLHTGRSAAVWWCRGVFRRRAGGGVCSRERGPRADSQCVCTRATAGGRVTKARVFTKPVATTRWYM